MVLPGAGPQTASISLRRCSGMALNHSLYSASGISIGFDSATRLAISPGAQLPMLEASRAIR